MNIQHKSYGSFEVAEPTQGQLESLFKLLRDGEINLEKISAPEYAGGVMRAVVSLGWITPPVDIDAAKPAMVIWLNRKVQNMISEAMTIDPE